MRGVIARAWADASLSAAVAGFVAGAGGLHQLGGHRVPGGAGRGRQPGADAPRGCGRWAWPWASAASSLSLRWRLPVLTAWYTPGAALLAATLAGVSPYQSHRCLRRLRLLIILAVTTGWFARVMDKVPMAVAAALLAGDAGALRARCGGGRCAPRPAWWARWRWPSWRSGVSGRAMRCPACWRPAWPRRWCRVAWAASGRRPAPSRCGPSRYGRHPGSRCRPSSAWRCRCSSSPWRRRTCPAWRRSARPGYLHADLAGHHRHRAGHAGAGAVRGLCHQPGAITAAICMGRRARGSPTAATWPRWRRASSTRCSGWPARRWPAAVGLPARAGGPPWPGWRCWAPSPAGWPPR